MNDIELQLKQIEEFGVLKWNIAEDITNIQEQNIESNEKKSVLEEIFPPREWENTNDELGMRKWRQTISRELPTNDTLSKMFQTFEKCGRLFKSKYERDCEPINALHNLFFDELLRQIIIENEDLGKIIYRIHKEFQNLVWTLKYIVDKSAAFDLDMDSKIEDSEVKDLTMKNKDLITKCEKASLKYSETLRQKELNENIEYLEWLNMYYRQQLLDVKMSNKQLQEQLNILSMPPTNTQVT